MHITKLKYRWVFWFLECRTRACYSEWQYPGFDSGLGPFTPYESCQWFRESKLVCTAHPLFLLFPLWSSPRPWASVISSILQFLPPNLCDFPVSLFLGLNFKDVWWQNHTGSIWRLRFHVKLKQEFRLRQIPGEQSGMSFISNSCFSKPTGNKHE